MKKFVCPVCGYVYEGENPPEKCPQCGAPGSTFKEVKEESKSWAAEHVVGIAKDVPEDILEGLRANFTGECSEVGMYLAMARVAHREGYPEIGLYWEKAAYEEAEHAAKFAEPKQRTALHSVSLNLLRELRKRALTLFTIPFMRWLVTKRDTAEPLRVFSRDISVNFLSFAK